MPPRQKVSKSLTTANMHLLCAILFEANFQNVDFGILSTKLGYASGGAWLKSQAYDAWSKMNADFGEDTESFKAAVAARQTATRLRGNHTLPLVPVGGAPDANATIDNATVVTDEGDMAIAEDGDGSIEKESEDPTVKEEEVEELRDAVDLDMAVDAWRSV